MGLLYNDSYDETSVQQLQRSPMVNTHLFANFQGFIDANMQTFVRTDEDTTRFLMRLWHDFEALSDGFYESIYIIGTGKPIHSASDGSVLSDGQASAGWLF